LSLLSVRRRLLDVVDHEHFDGVSLLKTLMRTFAAVVSRSPVKMAAV
jgi:hypothetical protein